LVFKKKGVHVTKFLEDFSNKFVAWLYLSSYVWHHMALGAVNVTSYGPFRRYCALLRGNLTRTPGNKSDSEYNIKVDLKEIWWEDVDWMH
jgi:hypothetical protein